MAAAEATQISNAVPRNPALLRDTLTSELSAETRDCRSSARTPDAPGRVAAQNYPRAAQSLRPGGLSQQCWHRGRLLLGPLLHTAFGGNPVACAAALVTIELLERELIDNAARRGTHLMSRMRDWPAHFPIVGEVCGLGLMLGIELVRDQQSKTKAPELRDHVVDLAF